jgi:hypothetical protein
MPEITPLHTARIGVVVGEKWREALHSSGSISLLIERPSDKMGRGEVSIWRSTLKPI